MRFKIDWASLIVGSKFTVFALFYFVFESNFPSTSPWGAYTWRGLFLEFYGISLKKCTQISLENLYVDIGVKRVNGNLYKVDTSL